MPQLQRLQAGHEADVLAFELSNRRYFATWVSDRGDEYFDQFAAGYQELMAQQERGRDAYYVITDDAGTLVARVNLYDIDGGAGELGYRVAEAAAGRGVATAAVRQMCELAVSEHGLHNLRARTTLDNIASQKVLSKTGFRPAGQTEIGGRAGITYERSLRQE